MKLEEAIRWLSSACEKDYCMEMTFVIFRGGIRNVKTGDIKPETMKKLLFDEKRFDKVEDER